MMAPKAEEEDEEDEFHESLDRILSSSCSSTSASDDDVNPPRRRAAAGSHLLRGVSARFQTMYDVWSSTPASVDERRRRLLKMLGLLGDPSLSRRTPDSDPKNIPLSLLDPMAAGDENSVGPNSEVDGDRYCRIRNLDSGEEFVVKELTEDGMWNKLREVGTGRQLTMEEFQASVIGHSPIVQELMRRDGSTGKQEEGAAAAAAESTSYGVKSRKKGSWLRSIRNMAGGVARWSSDERDTSSEKGWRRSSSGTDDSQEEVLHPCQGAERVRVRQYGKSWRELSGLYMNQEIHGHRGSIWSIRFSSDGRYLASAGKDCVVHVWQVVEAERKKGLVVEKGLEENGSCGGTSLALGAANASPEPVAAPVNLERDNSEKRRGMKVSASRKSFSLDYVVFTDYVFALSERPVCSFHGHEEGVLDLSWSKSMQLLSSSMDKTVRLWDMSDNSCLKIFSHRDYVTCIQFNPVDDNYFISGSLDYKVRMWSVEDRQVVDWIDLHEMVTAACYTPDGQGAIIGSHKGTCNFYKLSGNRFQQRTGINLQNKKKKSHLKKITGFQFIPGSSSEVLITSADSRIRVVDNIDLVHKLKGFRNTSSQISASITADGNHVICASEDSRVYIWRYDTDSQTGRSKGVVSVSQSYEHFNCKDVSVAAAWPGASMHGIPPSGSRNWNEEDAFSFPFPNAPTEPAIRQLKPPLPFYNCNGNWIPSPTKSNHSSNDYLSASWTDDKPPPSPTADKQSPWNSSELNIGVLPNRSAWGVVIVTAGHGGELKVFQNFGYPIRV